MGVHVNELLTSPRPGPGGGPIDMINVVNSSVRINASLPICKTNI